jgi:hypothetical protein
MYKEKIQECHTKYVFDQEHKRNLFLGNFSSMLIFDNTSNATLLDAFYR